MTEYNADGSEKTLWETYVSDSRWFYALVLITCLVGAAIWMANEWDEKFVHVVGIPWLLIASLFPAGLVLNHTLSVQWQPPKTNHETVGRDAGVNRSTGGGDSANPPVDPQAHITSMIDHEFGRWAIGINYYLPTFALAVAGLVVALLACQPPNCCGEVDDTLMEGLRYGSLGAYVYVLMTLCERSFRGDISPGLAQWSAGQLILGPLLGGVLASVLLPTTSLSQFSQQVLYFVAGMAPRQLLAVFSDTATRFFANNSEARVKAIIPLSALGGITTRVEDRLFEEGIEDTYQLAMSNPIRLTRDTPYELQQLVDWIDRALLHAALPEGAARLQGQGIRGAIDLARLAVDAEGKARETSVLVTDEFVKQLAGEAHLNEKVLANLIAQFQRNPQVTLLKQLAAFDGL